MTLMEEYEDSCYEELTRITDKKDIFLVKNRENGHLYIKKYSGTANKEVMDLLRNHPMEGVPSIYSCLEKDGRLQIIEDYIHGQTLQEYLESKTQLTEKEAFTITDAVCDILTGLHHLKPPVIHRDIKPSNIMLTEEGKVKLIDFGAARCYADGEKSDTVLLGTRSFAAPEQYGFYQSDERTDIYNLGVTLNYMLTGKTLHEQIAEGMGGRIVKKATQIDPKQRFQTAEEFKNALILQQNEYVSTESSGAVQKRNTSNLKKICLAVTALLLFCACITMDVTGESGIIYTGWKLWINRILALILAEGYLVFFGNVFGVRTHIMGDSKERTKVKYWLRSCLYVCLFTVVIAFIAVILAP